jgi:di/tricarboxylate transporter
MFLPYQAPPILVGIRIAGVELKMALKIGFLLAVITITLFYPLQYFWWNLINPFNMN